MTEPDFTHQREPQEPRSSTNLEEVLELLAVVQSRDVGRELQQVLSTLTSFLNYGFVKSPWNSRESILGNRIAQLGFMTV